MKPLIHHYRSFGPSEVLMYNVKKKMKRTATRSLLHRIHKYSSALRNKNAWGVHMCNNMCTLTAKRKENECDICLREKAAAAAKRFVRSQVASGTGRNKGTCTFVAAGEPPPDVSPACSPFSRLWSRRKRAKQLTDIIIYLGAN